MKDFLVKIKLIQYLTLQFEAGQIDFARKLAEAVEEGSAEAFFRGFNLFSQNKKEYVGNVGDSTFKIRRKRTGYDRVGSLALAKGNFSQQGKNLVIETEISGLNGTMIPYYGFLILFYPVFLIILANAKHPAGDAPGFVIPFLIAHGLLMFCLPYFMMKKSVNRLKYDLEREFFFLVKK